MTKKLWIAALMAGVIVGSFTTEDASAHTVFADDNVPNDGSGTYFTHAVPNLAATVYAGNDLAGNHTSTSFTIGWTNYAPGYLIAVRNYCNWGGSHYASKAITTAYDAVVSPACVSGTSSARGYITP